MGLFEDLTTYFWNWLVYYYVVGSVTSCWVLGGWDLVFGDDDGYAINRCLQSKGGLKVTFPVEYIFAGAPEGGV